MPRPISDSLDRALAATLDKVPAGGRGFLEADVSLQGAELEVGHRLSSTWRAGGYVARTWRGQLEAGARLRAEW